jgi:hypothetical protein
VMQILDLAELDDVHRPSMQRARGAPSTALFMATAIYDKALLLRGPNRVKSAFTGQ